MLWISAGRGLGVSLVLLVAGSAVANGQGKAPPVPVPAPPSARNTPPDNSRNNPFDTSLPTSTINRPIYISGRVMMDDGGPPPEPVSIERVCNGRAFKEGFTDSKGRFNIDLGRDSMYLADASEDVSSRQSMSRDVLGQGPQARERMMADCELRAVLPGYKSQSVSLINHRTMDNPDIGTILLTRTAGKGEGLTISMTNAMAPQEAKKAYGRGLDSMYKNKLTDAESNFQKAVKIYPKYASAWVALGDAQKMSNKPDEAQKSYTAAMEADPKYVPPYVDLADLAIHAREWEKGYSLSAEALKLDAVSFPQAHLYHGIGALNLDKKAEAEKSIREGLRLDAVHHFPEFDHVLAVILAGRGDLSESAIHLEAYLKLVPVGPQAEQARAQLAQVRAMQAKSNAPLEQHN